MMGKLNWIVLGAVALSPTARADDPAQRWTPAEVAAVIAESRLRMENPVVAFRDVRVYPQAAPDSYAVCGQANPEGREDTPYRTFVVSVTLPGNTLPAVEQFFGQDDAAAKRADAEAATRCRPDGVAGDTPGDARPGRQESPSPSAIQPPAPVSSPDQMTMRQGASLHDGPSGNARVIRSVHRGTRVRLFRRGPGGWLEIGDERPWGWMHQSMMTR